MNKALLLDRNYMAVAIITIRKAAKLITRGKVESVSSQEFLVQTGSGKFKIPTILRLTNPIPHRASGSVKFSRKNVMLRDNFICQYCFERLGKNSGTIDHVMPKSRGGQSDYHNCVTSCNRCNNFKANRTPEEAGLILKMLPKKPTFLTLNRNYLTVAPKEWENYLIGLLNEI
jgi:hypothetical protein